MKSTILFIDGENFQHKLKSVFKAEKEVLDPLKLDVSTVLNNSLKGFSVKHKRYYAARLREYPDTIQKSKALILQQRRLKTNLEKQGFEFIIAGNVRAQQFDGRVTFREKGVDVKMAVDLVSLAADGKLDTAIICSSDSDLQPAVTELTKRGVTVVYLGFEMNPNKGLVYTCDRTILLRNSEVLEIDSEDAHTRKKR